MVHVEPSGETIPTKFTLTGEVVAPAVVGSGTVTSVAAAMGTALVREMAFDGAGAGSTISETGFDSGAGVPGS